MRRECTEEENRLVKDCVADILTYPAIVTRTAYLPGNEFFVNGGTIINYVNYNRDDAYLTIAEDNFRDPMGNICCIQYPVPTNLNVTVGERVILVYSDTGAYIPLKVTERTKSLIPMQNPDYFESVDWNRTVKLPHPAVLDLDKNARPSNEKDMANIIRVGKSKNDKRLNIAIVLLSVLILFIFALIFIFSVGSFITSPLMAVVIGVLLLGAWIALTIVIAKGLRSGKTRGLKKLHYKKKVLFLNLRDVSLVRLDGIKIKSKQISVYEYKDGELKIEDYTVNNTVFLPKDIPYGSVVYKYTKGMESSELGLNYFFME